MEVLRRNFEVDVFKSDGKSKNMKKRTHSEAISEREAKTDSSAMDVDSTLPPASTSAVPEVFGVSLEMIYSDSIYRRFLRVQTRRCAVTPAT